MKPSPPAWIRRARSSASGASASVPSAYPASRNSLEAGAQPAFPPSVVVEVNALARELPARRGVPLARSLAELRREVMAHGLVAQISGATLWRWLSRDALRPWRHRSRIFPRDPEFAVKTGRHERRWPGLALGPRDYVLCADEKTSNQVRRRRHSSRPPSPGRPMYVEHEYERGGAWAYLAAWDVHHAKVFGRCAAKTGIAPFERLVAQVMRHEPYRSARQVFWIVDNGSGQRGQPAAARLQARWPQATLVHTPIHASWLNQVEIHFSIVQRKVLTPNDVRSLAAVRNRRLRFQARYEATASPFQWTFTRRDLHRLLAKLAHRPRRLAA